MGERGRPSAASLQVVPMLQDGELEVLRRPAAPDGLTDEEATVWDQTVGSEPAELVRPAVHGLLAEYCRHTVRGRRIAEMVGQAERAQPLDVMLLDRLYKMAERESRAASSIASRLRLTPQSTVSRKIARPPLVARPWEI